MYTFVTSHWYGQESDLLVYPISELQRSTLVQCGVRTIKRLTQNKRLALAVCTGIFTFCQVSTFLWKKKSFAQVQVLG